MRKEISAFDNITDFFSMQWVDVLAALLTPTIALLGAYIAWQQWQVNRANLKERLFERRMAVFKEAQSFLSEIMRDAKFSEESYWKFTDTCQRARFLFGKPVQDYLLSIRERAGKMKMYQKLLDGVPVGTKRSELVKKEHIEHRWLVEQFTPLFDTFDPFLSFKNHK